MPRLTTIARAALKEEVLFHACDLIAAGKHPSEPNLSSRLPGPSGSVLMTLRDELRSEGRLIYHPPTRGISSAAYQRAAARWKAEFEGRIKRQCRIRAVKMARDEPDLEERQAIEARKAEIRAQIAARAIPESAAEAARRARAEFRKATRGTIMIDRTAKASRFRGVYESTSARNPWTAKIGVDNKQRTVGSFATEEEAARAYDAARIAAGRSAVNFPDDPPPSAPTKSNGNGHTAAIKTLSPRERVPEGRVMAVAPPSPSAPTSPATSLGRELAAAAAIAEAQAGLDAAQAGRVLKFVGDHYHG